MHRRVGVVGGILSLVALLVAATIAMTGPNSIPTPGPTADPPSAQSSDGRTRSPSPPVRRCCCRTCAASVPGTC